MVNLNKNQFVKFSIVGTVGFVVDAGIVWVLTHNGIHPIFAQIVAFSIAVIITWWLNRNFSFHKSQKKWLYELLSYILGTSIGSIINNGIYIFLVLKFSLFFHDPVLAVAIGSLIGLLFNFTVSKFWVFKS